MIEKTRHEIRVLDAHIANKIAAGEVIERPASVVKELVENAVDAHATRIEVFCQEGGVRLVRVVDDGWGIAPSDLQRAFLPHATSKLADVADLESIATLGFRGEALASIGAVAQVAISSRERDAEAGYRIENRGGEIGTVRTTGCASGTDVTMRNLFYNTPARAKFLRTARTELGHIEDLVRRFALAFPEIGFRLVHSGRALLHTVPGEDRRARLREIYGPKLADQLLPVAATCPVGTLEGFLAPPSITRPNARELHFFVNGRYVRDRILHRVVKDTYRDALHHGRSPVVFLFLEIDPEQIDVNVHPTKAEVRWRNPRFLHSVVSPAMQRALRTADLAAGEAAPPSVEARVDGVRGAVADFLRRAEAGEEPRVFERIERPEAFSVFQVHDSYLVCETEEGMAIVDQHALHERVQYDRIVKRLSEGGVEAQRLLVPEEVELGAEDVGLLAEHADLLRRCGIEWSPFGKGAIAVETFPAVLPREQAGPLLRDLVELLRAHGADVDARTLFHEVADTLACKAAVRFGDRLSREEAYALLVESGALDRAFVCPHGRPTVWRIPFSDLERRFKRR